MKIYQVGGCVRDKLLGRTPDDIDYVATGATAEDLLDLGYQQVGISFPVFLNPENGGEYALARSERKVGVGYSGFEVVTSTDITIEDDLKRRDLTINAMAIDPDTDEIIDPYGGQQDLKNGILRHVSDAFAEDPLRILRVARFAARYDFTVHESTLELMRLIKHELNDIPQDRIWKEISRGLQEPHAYKMFKVLQECGALSETSLEGWNSYVGISQLQDYAGTKLSLLQACSLATVDFDDDTYDLYRIPTYISDICKIYNNNFVYGCFMNWETLEADQKIECMEKAKLIHNEQRVLELLPLFVDDITSDEMMLIRRDIDKVNNTVIDPSSFPKEKNLIKSHVRHLRRISLTA